MINLPTSGLWLGLVKISLAAPVDVTIHEWNIIYDKDPTYIKYRRTGLSPTTGTVANRFKDWTLKADTRVWRWLFRDETMATIRYTATSDISFNVETTRSTGPLDYATGLSYPGNGAANAVAYPGDVYTGVGYRVVRT